MRPEFPYRPSDRFVWILLAFQAGYLNIGGLLAVQSLIVHVTGAFSFFGQQLAKQAWGQVLFFLVILVFFWMGAFLSALFIEKQQPTQASAHGFCFLILALLLMLVMVGGESALFGRFGGKVERWLHFFPVALLAACSGAQNAIITMYTKAIVRTTHLTGPLTDLGIGSARILLTGDPVEKNKNAIRLDTMIFFATGSALATWLFPLYGYKSFAVSSALFLLIGLRLPKLQRPE